jgi:predicted peptidase
MNRAEINTVYMKSIYLCCCLLVQLLTGWAQDLSQYEKKEFIRDHHTLPYRILYPLHYDRQIRYPLVVFLHGQNEIGSDNASQLVHGGALFLQDSIRANYPAIVLFPQCTEGNSWAYMEYRVDEATKKMSTFLFNFREEPSIPIRLLKDLMDSLVRSKVIDKKRIYVGGLSMGGFGTYDLLTRYADLFAAAFPICAGGDIKLAEVYARSTPLWIFHGAADSVVSVEYARTAVRVLHALGVQPRYTEYPGVGHDSWDRALAERELVPWLFSQKRK